MYDNKRIYRIVDGYLEGLNVQVVGNFLQNTSEKLLVFSTLIKQGDEILLTHLPNAINGLKVESGNQAK